jgi:hypothetical protein
VTRTPGALTTIARLLDQAGIPYAVIGAHGVNAWIEPRVTADVDVTADADAAAMRRLSTILAKAGWTLERQHGTTEASGPDFVRFVSVDGLVSLEVQAAKTDLQREVIRRAAVAEDGVRVATPEDLLVLKLIADRAKDQGDLAALAALPTIDWPYVERWAEAWGIRDALVRVRSATGRLRG